MKNGCITIPLCWRGAEIQRIFDGVVLYTITKNSGGFEETAGVLYITAYIKLKFSLPLLLQPPHQFDTFSSVLLVLQTLRKYHLPLQIPVL